MSEPERPSLAYRVSQRIMRTAKLTQGHAPASVCSCAVPMGRSNLNGKHALVVCMRCHLPVDKWR